MALNAKKVSYKSIETTPGIGQLSIFRLSGQRKLPVLVDKETVIADSSAIIRYLDSQNKEPALIPSDPKQATQAYLIEDWADTTLANAVQAALLNSAAIDPELREALIPEAWPTPFKEIIKGLPNKLASGVTEMFSSGQQNDLIASLEQIAKLIEKNDFLVGEQISVADLAVAAQLSLLRFPDSSKEALVGKGVAGISNHPNLQSLFHWRDQLEFSLLHNVNKEK